MEWSKVNKEVNEPRKKQKINKEELKSLLSQCEEQQTPQASLNSNPAYNDSIVGLITRQINDSRFSPATPEELQLDHILSGVPYRDMLESLFGTVSGQVPTIPIITNAYEESYMREAGSGERPCAMGSKCECIFIDSNAPFVCVEFDLPMEKPTNPNQKLCVLCSRKSTQKLFYDTCYSGIRIQALIQRYGNLCNQPGGGVCLSVL
jgi:hypothetical protein